MRYYVSCHNMGGMDELAQEINAACQALGVPSDWCVKKRDEVSLSLDVEGECWGYRFLEVRGEVYVANDSSGKERRWKLRKTAVDRLSKRVAQMYQAKVERRRQADRVCYVQGLLKKVDGLHQSNQQNLFWVDHSDCRFWVYPTHISVESRNYGLFAKLSTDPSELDAVIEYKAKKVVAAINRITAAVEQARTECDAIEDGLSSSAA